MYGDEEAAKRELERSKKNWNRLSDEEKAERVKNMINNYVVVINTIAKELVEKRKKMEELMDLVQELYLIIERKDWKRFEDIFFNQNKL